MLVWKTKELLPGSGYKKWSTVVWETWSDADYFKEDQALQGRGHIWGPYPWFMKKEEFEKLKEFQGY